MNDKELVFKACEVAINELREDGSSGVALKVDNIYHCTTWEDVISKLAVYLEVQKYGI